MIRAGAWQGGPPACKPRASGDDPGRPSCSTFHAPVNPARAGMIPYSFNDASLYVSKPRASGDDPKVAIKAIGTVE